jgi:CMP-N,N'-diacetyllegionaminic acid synthase
MKTQNDRILFLVVARSGSKGVPGKNILDFNGTNPLELRVRSIIKSGVKGDIVLSTDSENYADIGIRAGARVPFIRPKELASDSTPSMAVIEHALNFLFTNEKLSYTYLVLVEPSTPFTRPEDILTGVALLKTDGVKSVVSVRETEVASLFIAPFDDDRGKYSQIGLRISQMSDIRRQAMKTEYTPSGNFYGSHIEDLRTKMTFYHESTYAFIVPRTYGLEIEDKKDAAYAQYLWNSRTINTSLWF